MLMMGVQVDGLRKHPNGRVDQLEDRYLGMVEAPSSNLGTSTIRTDFINSMVDLRHEESVLICFLHWLGMSTRDDSRHFCWPFSHKRGTNKRFFVGSACPLSMILTQR